MPLDSSLLILEPAGGRARTTEDVRSYYSDRGVAGVRNVLRRSEPLRRRRVRGIESLVFEEVRIPRGGLESAGYDARDCSVESPSGGHSLRNLFRVIRRESVHEHDATAREKVDSLGLGESVKACKPLWKPLVLDEL